MMRKWWLGLVVLAAVAVAHGDERAQAVVARMMTTLGGPEALAGVDSIAFTFAVEADGEVRGSRRHRWWPGMGGHQVRYHESDGTPVDVAWNLQTRTGSAARGGVELSGDELTAAFDRAHRMWINDTYWLLMPYKLYDSGVHLAYDGEETADGRTYDKVRVTFDAGVGLTSGDTYWAWIARESGRVERWSFVLEGREPPPAAFDWLDQGYYGPLLLSPRKQRVGAGQAILTHRVVVTLH